MVEIGGTQIDAHWLEYAAELEPGKIVACESEAEARSLGGRVLVRHVFETSWEGLAASQRHEKGSAGS